MSEAADGRKEVVWARTGEEKTRREDREQKRRGFGGILRECVNNTVAEISGSGEKKKKKKKRGFVGLRKTRQG